MGIVPALTQCGGSSFKETAEQLLKESKAASSINEVLRGDSKPAETMAAKLSKARSQAPADASSSLLASLKVDQDALNLVDETLVEADQTRASLPASQKYAAGASAGGDKSLADRLVGAGQEVLPDITCDIAWQYLEPQEQQSVGAAARVPDVVTPTTEAIIKYIRQKLMRAVGGPSPAQVLAVSLYAQKLLDKASQYTANLSTLIRASNWQATRAYYYYARLCLVPPS